MLKFKDNCPKGRPTIRTALTTSLTRSQGNCVKAEHAVRGLRKTDWTFQRSTLKEKKPLQNKKINVYTNSKWSDNN